MRILEWIFSKRIVDLVPDYIPAVKKVRMKALPNYNNRGLLEGSWWTAWGDSWESIAEEWTGEPRNFFAIWEHNPHARDESGRLIPGRILSLPE